MDTLKLTIPLRVTTTDSISATSAEALSLLCQLLSGVDMAGAILEPDVSNYVVGLYCSSMEKEQQEEEYKDNECIAITSCSPGGI
jgi:hypothetical protein